MVDERAEPAASSLGNRRPFLPELQEEPVHIYVGLDASLTGFVLGLADCKSSCCIRKQ